MNTNYPIIDMKKTGENIRRLRLQNGVRVKDIAEFMGFSELQAIYKWQRGDCLPTVDNLFALSRILNTTIEGILVEDDEVPFVFYWVSMSA